MGAAQREPEHRDGLAPRHTREEALQITKGIVKVTIWKGSKARTLEHEVAALAAWALGRELGELGHRDDSGVVAVLV